MTQHTVKQRLQHHAPSLLGARRQFAVLCPFVQEEGALSLLFEVRSATLRRQPGEVCFPGGKVEPGESWSDCALRETWEELNIPPSSVELWGMTDFIAHPSGFMMQPVVGLIHPQGFASLCPSPDEVAEVFTVPLEFFRTTPPAVHYYTLTPSVPDDFPYAEIGFPDGYPFQGGRVEEPIWHYGGHVIWGLTARIVRNLVQLMETY